MQGRNLETIVANHELARARITQGLPVWSIKQYLDY